MKVNKEQFDHIYKTELQHITQMLLSESLTVEEFHKEVSELYDWVLDFFG